MTNKITTIGNLTIDDIILFDEKTMHLESIGGNALFSAIGARIWGIEPTVHARIGTSFPESSIKQFGNYGIKMELVRVPNNDIRDWALYEPGGARQFINHLTSGSHYDMSITGGELSENRIRTGGVHVASMPTDIQYSIVKKVDEYKGNQTVVSLDPHVEYLKEENFNNIAYEMLNYVDVFMPSKEEVQIMFGSNNLRDAARAFAENGPGVVVIKKSIEGALVYVKKLKKYFDVPIYPSKTVDPTGAGDSFCGGFLACFLETRDPVLSAAYGTVSASYVVEHVGALTTLKSKFGDKNRRLEIVKNNISEL